MAALTAKDIQVLTAYAQSGNRIGYWNYLASLPGADAYGRLALSVVRNDNLAGSTANHFAANYAESSGVTISARQWEEFGKDLLKEDLRLRLGHFQAGRLDQALNLPAQHVEEAHDISFARIGLDGKAWTPKELFLAARRNGGEAEVEKVWQIMLDDGNYRGLGRMGETILAQAVHQFSRLEGGFYIARMTMAWFQATVIDDFTVPNVIRGHVFDPASQRWYEVNPQSPAGRTVVTDQSLIQALNDERAVRIERISHPKHPLDTAPTIEKRFLISENSHEGNSALTVVDDTSWQQSSDSFARASALTEFLIPAAHWVAGPGMSEQPVESVIRLALADLGPQVTAYRDTEGRLVLTSSNGSATFERTGKATVSLRDGEALLQKAYEDGVLVEVARTVQTPDGFRTSVSGPNGEPLRSVQRSIGDDSSSVIALTHADGTGSRLVSNSDGSVFQHDVVTKLPDGSLFTTSLTGAGIVRSLSRKTVYDDGSSIDETRYPDGRAETVTRDENQVVVRRSVQEPEADGQTLTKLYDGNGALLQTTTLTQLSGGAGTSEVISRPDGSELRILKNAQGLETSRIVVPSYAETLTSGIQDATSLINAIRSGQPLPIVASGLKLLNTLDREQAIPNLGQTATIAQGALSLYNLHNAFGGGGSDLGKVTALGNAIVSVNAAMYAANIGLPALNVVAGTVARVLPPLQIIMSIKAGDPVGVAMGVGTMLQGSAFLMTNPLGWALLAISLYKAMEEPPEAWGIGTFKFGDGNELAFDTQGESFGKDRVQMLMLGNGQSPTNPDGTPNPNYFGGLKGYLEQMVADAAQANPEDPLGIIPQRLPTLSWREARQDQPGYAITDIDPVTGEQRYPFLRYGDDWSPYNADPTDPEQRRNIFERLVMSALERGAVAPMWEVRTAKMQQEAGDPLAGLTEEERAGRRGLGATVDPLTNTQLPGQFRPIALDLNGDGQITTVSNADNDRAFNWDGSGFDKQVGWVGAGEGMLFLDRNPNGLADSGRELFSNSLIADAAKGVRGLAWVDANADGVIDAADPVFNELRLWQDANGDAVADFSELKRLDALGITQLDYNNNRFTVNGNLQSMQSVALETSAAGQRVSVVPDGIKVEFDDGRVLVYPTRVSDASRNPRVAAVSDGSAVEGAAMDFTVTLNVKGSVVTTVALGVAAGSAAEADLQLPIEVSFNGGASFVAVSGSTVDVPIGVQQFIARVRTADDSTVETLESFTLLAASGANAAPVGGTGTLVDNEGAAQLSISGPASVGEAAGRLTYTVTLSNPSASAISVNYATAAGTANAGDDFAGASGTLVFAAGETTKTFTVEIGNDAGVEANEAFSVVLSGASGATIAVASVTTSILDDDTPAGDSFTAGDDDIGVFNEDVSETPTGTPATLPVFWAQLFGNDTFNGSADGLAITQLSNAQHVSVTLDTANQQVMVTPHANFVGQASFQYTVQAPNGDARVATAFLTFTEVNDRPVVDYQIANRTIFGYGVLGTVVSGGSGEDTYETVNVTRDNGIPFYAPYQTVAGRRMTYVDFGESGGYEYGPLIDTLIPKSYFEREYARIAAQQSGESWGSPGSIQILIDGVTYDIAASPATYTHGTPTGSEIDNDGRVTATDPDGSSSFRYEIVSQGLYGTTEINENTGHFSYTGRRYVDRDALGGIVGQNVDTDEHTRYEETFVDVVVVRAVDLTDPTGRTFTDKEVRVTHFGPKPMPNIQSGAKKPIAIDLNGDGFHFTDVDDSNVFFDVNGDGWRRRMAWNNPNDGFIAFDKNGDGKIDSYDEISFVPYKPDGQTDLEGLRAFDTNRDGMFSAADEKWASFGVWQDADSDGVSDAGEFKSMSDLGIASIGLTSDGQFQVINGQTVHGTAVATRGDGTTLAIADVSLRYRNETRLTTPGGGTVIAPAPMVQPGTVFNGTADKDLVLGTTGSDMFVTGDGDDVVTDDFGNDGVQAGAGDDLVYTGVDNDVVDGGTGNDVVFAGVGNDLVFGDDGDDMLMLEGGNDVAFGGAGQDFIGGGEGNDAVSGDAGDDKLFGEGGWDALFGQDGDDEVWGHDGNDLLDGGAGNDLLVGGAGDDAMDGGAGDDTYEVDSTADTVVELADGGIDSVRASIAYTLADVLENLTLTGDANLNGTGNAGDNVLVGNAGSNTLRGLAGNDLLDGGLGADALIGGTGDDTYMVDHAGDAVIEAAGEGIDTVRSRVTVTLAEHVENLTLVGINAIDGAGNALANVLVGNSAGNLLDGREGADTMSGGQGNDRYVVDDHGDTVAEAAGEGHDGVLVQGLASYTLGDHVEALELGTGATDGNGNALDNTLLGNAAANRLDGGAGADYLAGREGDDTYVVDNAGDRVFEAMNQGKDTVLSSVSHVLGVNVENLSLTGAADLAGTGNALANTLVGNAGGNVLDGAEGADTMSGGAGDDTYVVDNAGDLVIEAVNGGSDTVLSSVSYALASNVEALTLIGSADIDATGNALANTLTGNAGNNMLDGGEGADRMAGGLGDDTYIVDNAADAVTETANEGIDTVLSSVTHALASHIENLTLTGGADIDATGNTLDNRLTGNGGDNVLDGGTGADTMAGGDGDDRYVVDNAGDLVIEQVGQGIDQVASSIDYELTDQVEELVLTGSAVRATGNALANRLTGNAQSNHIDGAAGADAMAGGLGDDTYVVDDAGDVVTEGAGEGNDTIHSSISQVLAANLENLTLTGTSDIDATGNELANVLIGNTGHNVIDGGTGSDTMTGGAGDDGYVVDDAGDSVVESAAQGFDRVSAGIDYVLTAHVEQLTLTGSALNGTGNNLDNLLFGNDHANVLDGAAGADTMSGGQGDDRYVVDHAADTVIEAVGGGNDTVVSAVSHTLAANVENLILAGSSAIDATGNALDNVLVGNAGANRLGGGDGRDVLAGGAGNDLVDGGAGDDLYQYHQGDGRDTLVDASGSDTLRFGAGITLDSIAGRMVTVDGQNKVFLSILSTDGTEQQDQGIELSAGSIERVEFANGTVATLADLMVTARTINGDQQSDTLYGDRRDELIYTGGGNDLVYARWGHDVVYGGSGADRLFGEGGNDTLRGDSSNDELWGGAGNDVLDGGAGQDLLMGGTGDDQMDGGSNDDVLDGGDGNDALVGGTGEDRIYGGAGDDVLDGGTDSDLLAAGAGNDTIIGGTGPEVIVAGAGNDRVVTGTGRDFVDGGSGDDSIVADSGTDFIAAGAGNDTVDTGGDQDLLAFNRGDGADVVLGTGWDRDTVSLGGGLRYADMRLRKVGNDLVLDLGQGDSLGLKDWYTSEGRRSVDTLQVVTIGGDYDAASLDRTKNRKVVTFDFAALANRFDEMRAASGNDSWAIAGELNVFFKAGSDTQAIGGDLAYRYATTGSYGDLDWMGVRNRMGGLSGSAWQSLTASTAVNPWTALQAGISLTADQTVGLPSPITPMAPLTADELAFAALNGGTIKPSWLGSQPGPVLP